MPQGIDGIEPVGNGDFILTGWSGYIFYVPAAEKVETLQGFFNFRTFIVRHAASHWA